MIRAASVGLGWWGKTLANAITGHSDKIKVTKATTRSLSNIEDYCKQIGAEIAPNYDALLADPDVDAVILATPHSLHLEQIEKAAAAGKHVFVEKPITLKPEDARRAFDAAGKGGVVLAVGFNRRFHPNFVRVRKLVDDGTLGQIVHVEGSINAPGIWMYQPGSWRATAEETPAGGMTGLGIHVVDQMIAVAGPVSSVFAQTAKLIKKGELDEITSAVMRFAGGPTASLTTSIATGFYYNFRVFGENGCAEIRNRDLSEFVYSPREGDVQSETVAGFSMERAELESFADAITGATAYPVTGDQAVNGIAVLDAIVRSAESGRPVSI